MDDLRALEEEPTMLLGLSLHSASLSLLALFSQPGFLCEQQQFPLIVPALCFPKLSTWEEAAPFNFCIKTIQGQDCDWPSWCQCLPTPPHPPLTVWREWTLWFGSPSFNYNIVLQSGRSFSLQKGNIANVPSTDKNLSFQPENSQLSVGL